MENQPEHPHDDRATVLVSKISGKPIRPLQVSLAALIMTIFIGMWAYILISYIVWVVTVPLQGVSLWESETFLTLKDQLPLIFFMMATFVLMALHVVVLFAYLRGHRWAAYVLTASLLLGMLCTFIVLLLVGVIMAGLNGAPMEEVEFLLDSNSSPLYVPLYVGMPYLVVSVIALGLIWSRAAREYMHARSLWRAEQREDSLLF